MSQQNSLILQTKMHTNRNIHNYVMYIYGFRNAHCPRRQ